MTVLESCCLSWATVFCSSITLAAMAVLAGVATDSAVTAFCPVALAKREWAALPFVPS